MAKRVLRGPFHPLPQLTKEDESFLHDTVICQMLLEEDLIAMPRDPRKRADFAKRMRRAKKGVLFFNRLLVAWRDGLGKKKRRAR